MPAKVLGPSVCSQETGKHSKVLKRKQNGGFQGLWGEFLSDGAELQ